ncbi:kinase-like domain-containing protein [Russula compacta]|nr:kinase-like domain-containing protein [Russula compacta]
MVYLGRDIKNGQDVAMKLEVALEWGSKLKHKYNVYWAISGIHEIPKMLWYRMEGMLLFISYSKLSVLKSLHDHHYIHLDVKPDNFMIGTGDRLSQVFLIDFRLTWLFHNLATCKHIMQVKGLDITGTVHYSLINSHLGLTQSQCDNLELLAYIIVYLVKGWLPWQGIAVHSSQLEQVTMAKTLCEGLPQSFIRLIQHIQSLSFEDRPDYQYLHSLLMQCILPLNQTPPITPTEPLLVTSQ